MFHPVERLLRPQEDDADLPFVTSINEATVLNTLQNTKGTMKQNEVDVIRQWMKFNKGLNEREGEPYVTWVNEVYSHIESICEMVEENLENVS